MSHHHDHQHRLDVHGLGQPTTRIGRRRFITDLGRGTFAIAVLGLQACSSSDSTGATTSTSTTSESPGPEGAGDPDASLQWSRVVLGNVSAYVLVRGSEAAIVDTGNPGSAEEINASLQTLGVGWSDVNHIILTHSHGDHVGSLSEIVGLAPAATAYAGEADIASITAPNPLRSVGDGDDVFGLEIINTPGHTPGSISAFDAELGLLVAGDALTSDAEGTEVLGPNERFTPDMAQAVESIRKLAAYDVDSVVVGHGAPVEGVGDQLTALAEGG